MHAELKQAQQFNKRERDEIILEYSPLIKYIAGRMALRLPSHIEMDDIINSGVIGLIDALDKYDQTKGVQFKTYAEFRIRGAIVDNLRTLDWLPRSVRKTATLLENTYASLERKLNRPATDEEAAEALNVDLQRYYEMLQQTSGISLLSLDMLSKHDDPRLKLIDCLVDDETKTPLAFAALEEIRHMIAEAIDSLPDREKKVMSLYYFDDLTMKEISLVLKLTESRVSQIHTKAIIILRGYLKEKMQPA